MFWTYDEIKASTVGNVIGNCPDNDDFLAYVTEACSRLLRRGDWANTVVPIQICTYAGCAVFPRYVKAVRKMNLCGARPLPVNGLWWQFLDTTERCNRGSWWGRNINAQANGITPVFSDIYGDGRYVRAFCMTQADIGKSVTIFGEDNNGQALRTMQSDGSYTDGIVLTLAIPYVQSLVMVRRIDRVLKDQTQGNVPLFAYNLADNVLEPIAVYEPSETNPQFIRFKMNIPRCTTWPTGQVGDCGRTLPIVALVKLQFIPPKTGTDLVLLPPDAIKDMVQSIRFKESGDIASANEYEKSAIRELNLEINELLNWDDATPVSSEPFSNTGIGAQQMF